MSHYQRYPAYRDSGVEWIGEIPGHWTVKRLKQTMRLITTKSGGETQNIALENIESWSGRYLPSDTEFEGDGVTFQVGDILFGKLRPYLAKAYLAEFQGAAVGDFHVMRPTRNSLFGRYALYLILNHGVISIVDGSTFGAKMPRVSWDFMGNIQLPVPPLEEQQAIASFLDRKTAEIDELITKKEELLKKLDEKRTALITRAVTKGIDPSVPMKESGVEWLGEVPEHWEVTRIKFIFPRLYSGVSVNSDTFPSEQDSIGVLKTSCVYGNRFSPEENKKVIDEETEKVACPVTKDSVIISRMNTPDLVGSCGYVEFDYPNLFLPDRLWIARFENHKKMVGKFVWYLISSDTIVKLTGILATGTSGSMKNLSQDSFLNIATAVPPIEEQHTITLFLDQTTATIDRQKTQVTEAIERLKEYRSALITDAVTGKMDVHSIGKKESLST